MKYRVVYAPSLRDDIDAIIGYLLSEGASIEAIEHWCGSLFDLIDSLESWPHRFPVDELQTRITSRETRKANVGDYLVFYDVDEERRQVNATALIHGARDRGSADSP